MRVQSNHLTPTNHIIPRATAPQAGSDCAWCGTGNGICYQHSQSILQAQAERHERKAEQKKAGK